MIDSKAILRACTPGILLGFIAFSLPALAGPGITYSLQNVEIGGQNQKVLIPFVTDMPSGNPSVRVSGILNQLRMVRPDFYNGVTVNLDGGFSQNGKVSVDTGILQGENLSHVVGELYYSLLPLGLKTMMVPALGDTPVTASSIPYAVAAVTVPAWRALPPSNYRGVLVRASDSILLDAESFYAKILARDTQLGDAIADGLKSIDPMIRIRVAEGLSSLSVSNASEKILPLLRDADTEVRVAAIRALEPYKEDGNVQSALEGVVQNDTESGAKAAAVQVLVAAGRSEFQVFLFIEKLSDSNPMVVMDAVRKLAEANNTAATASLVDVLTHNSPDVREEALAGLVKGKNGAGMQRALQMNGVSDDLKLRVAKAMTGLSANNFVDEGLSYILVAGTPEESLRAAGALGERKSIQGIPSLVEGLNHFDAKVRETSAAALGEIGSPQGLEPLASMARGQRESDRLAAKNASVALLKSLSLDKVIEFSNHPTVEIRRFALESLGKFAQGGRNQKVIQELQNKLMDSDASLRQAAAVSLSEIEDPAIGRTFMALREDADPLIRSRVAVTLGWSKNPGAGGMLITMLGDSNSEVKLQAAKAIARRKDYSALDELLKYTTYGKPEVRISVMGAVVAVSSAADNERLMSVFQNSLYDQEVQVKLYAIEGMSRHLGTPSAPTAISNLASIIIDPSEEVQTEVVVQLGLSKDAMATEALARALFSDFKGVKVQALEAMRMNGQGNADKPLQEFIRNEQDPELLQKANEIYDELTM